MKVGFIGLGNVGAKLSGCLLRKGFDVTILDSNPEAARSLIEQGAKSAGSAKDVAETCDVIITCLPSPKVSAEVLEAGDGVIAGLSEGKIWLEMSSSDAEEVKRLGELVEATNVRIVVGGVDARAVETQEEYAVVLCGRDRLEAFGLGGAHALDLVSTRVGIVGFPGVPGVGSGERFVRDAGA